MVHSSPNNLERRSNIRLGIECEKKVSGRGKFLKTSQNNGEGAEYSNRQVKGKNTVKLLKLLKVTKFG